MHTCVSVVEVILMQTYVTENQILILFPCGDDAVPDSLW